MTIYTNQSFINMDLAGCYNLHNCIFTHGYALKPIKDVSKLRPKINI